MASSLGAVEELHALTSGSRTGAVHAIKWATTRRYMTLETLGMVSDTAVVSLPAMAV
jgi:hypothetical protein